MYKEVVTTVSGLRRNPKLSGQICHNQRSSLPRSLDNILAPSRTTTLIQSQIGNSVIAHGKASCFGSLRQLKPRLKNTGW